MYSSEDTLNLFLNAFCLRDIAEALPSFDEATPVAAMQGSLELAPWDAVGVRRAGIVSGWLSRDDVLAQPEVARPRSFDSAPVHVDTASLDAVAQALAASPFLFVRAFGQVSAVVSRKDFQKPPARMWLFGLITVMELRITSLIDEYCPNETWRQFLSPNRLQIAADLQAERRRRNQQPTLLDCLQFADKGQIVARQEDLRQRTRFSSRRAVEQFVKDLQCLRNNLAHSQDIAGDWPVIQELAANLRRMVAGIGGAERPAEDPSSAS